MDTKTLVQELVAKEKWDMVFQILLTLGKEENETLAICYGEGKGCEKDVAKAFQIFSKLDEDELSSEALWTKVHCCREMKQKKLELETLVVLSEQDDMEACYQLACQLFQSFHGDGQDDLPPNPRSFLYLFQKASDAGVLKASFQLGEILLSVDTFSPSSTEKAMSLFEKIACASPESQEKFLEPGQLGKALFSLAMHYDMAHKEDTGQCISFGVKGTLLGKIPSGVSKQRIQQLFEQSAALNHAPACFFLGTKLANEAVQGKNPEKNILAVTLLEKAISLGEFNAVMCLGQIYSRGAPGILRNPLKALQLFEKNPHCESFYAEELLMGRCCLNSLERAKDLKKALDIFRVQWKKDKTPLIKISIGLALYALGEFSEAKAIFSKCNEIITAQDVSAMSFILSQFPKGSVCLNCFPRTNPSLPFAKEGGQECANENHWINSILLNMYLSPLKTIQDRISVFQNDPSIQPKGLDVGPKAVPKDHLLQSEKELKRAQAIFELETLLPPFQCVQCPTTSSPLGCSFSENQQPEVCFIPCGHICLCKKCGEKAEVCPVCLMKPLKVVNFFI